MSGFDDAMAGAEDERRSEASDWIARLTDASRDFGSIGAEAAAEFGL